MIKGVSQITILFDDPFWIGLFEREYDGKYEVARIVFGAEPKDAEVYEFFLKNYGRLKFSPPMKAHLKSEKPKNPKRIQKEIKKCVATTGIGTKAQQALKLQQEQNKVLRKAKSKLRREETANRNFLLKQEKRREKHKGH